MPELGRGGEQHLWLMAAPPYGAADNWNITEQAFLQRWIDTHMAAARDMNKVNPIAGSTVLLRILAWPCRRPGPGAAAMPAMRCSR